MMAFLNLRGEQLSLIFKDAAGTVLHQDSKGIGNSRTCSTDWYNYFFCALPTHGQGLHEDIFMATVPPNSATMAFYLNSPLGMFPSVDMIVGGDAIDVGKAEYNVSTSLIDDGYYKKEYQDGGVVLVREDLRERMMVKVEIPSKRAIGVKREVKQMMSDILLFVADPEKDSHYEHLMEWGFIRDFRLKITNAVYATGHFTIEEIL
jgi:hypothetical protein